MRATIIYVGINSIAFDFNIPCKDETEKEKFAEMVFDALNNPSSPVRENLGVRSFSVGDLILFPDGVYYICGHYGWKELNREQVIRYQKRINESETYRGHAKIKEGFIASLS